MDRTATARRQRPFSIRRRIFALALALLLAASVVLIVFIRDYAERASDRAFDRLLAASALLQVAAVVIFVSQLWPRVYGRNKLGKPAGSQGSR